MGIGSAPSGRDRCAQQRGQFGDDPGAGHTVVDAAPLVVEGDRQVHGRHENHLEHLERGSAGTGGGLPDDRPGEERGERHGEPHDRCQPAGWSAVGADDAEARRPLADCLAD